MTDMVTQPYYFAHSLIIDFFYLVSWIDQRVNLNEGVIALVTFLAGIGMQNFSGARKFAGYGFIALALVFAIVAFFQGPVHILRGAGNFAAVLPEPFSHIHSPYNAFIASDNTSIIASDDAELNSVQLTSGTLRTKPTDYLNARCPKSAVQVMSYLIDANELEADEKSGFSLSFVRHPKGTPRDACWLSWHVTGEKVDHYEVYAVAPDGPGGAYLYAHLHLRAEMPNHVLVGADYVQIRNSLLISTGIRISNMFEIDSG
jgi:hypothetical protein